MRLTWARSCTVPTIPDHKTGSLLPNTFHHWLNLFFKWQKSLKAILCQDDKLKQWRQCIITTCAPHVYYWGNWICQNKILLGACWHHLRCTQHVSLSRFWQWLRSAFPVFKVGVVLQLGIFNTSLRVSSMSISKQQLIFPADSYLITKGFATVGCLHWWQDLSAVFYWGTDRSGTKYIFSWFVCLKNAISVPEWSEAMRLVKTGSSFLPQ